MRVSVLIPYYNDREFLPIAIESVLNQTFNDFELILVNHATTDDCREIAHSYNDKRIVHIDMDKNYGAGTGLIMEQFLKKATGEYIKLFCADDVMNPNCLKDLVEYMDTHPEKDFAFGDVEYINNKNKLMNNTWFKNRRDFKLQNDEIASLKLLFAGRGFLPYIGCIIKTDALRSIELDKSFISLFDMSIWASLLLKGYKMGYLTNIVAKYRIHDKQSSSLKNRIRIGHCSFYESHKYIDIFIKSNNLNLLKELFKDNAYVKRVKDLTEEDMKFIVCYETMFTDFGNLQLTGYSYIYDMLQDPQKRKYLEEKFNFGIKELRDVYSTLNECKPRDSAKFLLYLLFKKFIKFITFEKQRRERHRQETL